jgi:RNA polymerase sigma-70 factor (ECF subfamily)
MWTAKQCWPDIARPNRFTLVLGWRVCRGDGLGMNPAEPTPEQNDRELLARIAQRDTAAFAQLYDQFSRILFSIAHQILRDPAQAEDVLQEVFLQVWNRASDFDPELGKPLTWVVTLTRNRAIDRLRAAKRTDRLLEAATEEAQARSDDAPDSATALMQLEAATRIRNALAQLPKQQRQAIELAFFRGLTQTEIASALKEPLGTIKARIRRGMLQLRQFLTNET